MPAKINPKIKQFALEKVRDGLTSKEIAALTGVNARTIDRWKNQGGIQPRTSVQDDVDTSQESNDKTTLDFDDSPEPIEKKPFVEEAVRSLKGMLGIADKKDDAKVPPVLSAKLDAKRQQFVDSATPTLSLAFIALASFLWSRIGSEYSQLAPDEEVAEKIVRPLLRVYARHANFLTDINPDVADIGASMFALVGYVHVSMQMYAHIKKEKEDYGESDTALFMGRPQPTGNENGSGNSGNRHAAFQRSSGENGSINDSNVRNTTNFDVSHLADKEQRQFAALSRLSQLDYQSRARRSGRPL
jgi:hypothetical protein